MHVAARDAYARLLGHGLALAEVEISPTDVPDVFVARLSLDRLN